jgi:hypothetical protein
VAVRVRRRRGKNTKRFARRENKKGKEERGFGFSFLVVKIKKSTALRKNQKLVARLWASFR